MRASYAILVLLLLANLPQDVVCPQAPDAPFVNAPVRGLTFEQLQHNTECVVPADGSQRVQVSPGYWVRARVELTSHGNGLLYVVDDRGECLRTRIYDQHAEDDPWLKIEGGMFSYEFRDDDGDAELELQVWGTVEVWDEQGLIDSYEYFERWDRSQAGLRRWYLAGSNEGNHLRARVKPEEPEVHESTSFIGPDADGHEWSVRTSREVGSWDYECEVLRDKAKIRTLDIHSRWDPEFCVVSAASVSFLVVVDEGMRGSGMSSAEESWYHLGQEDVRLVRSFIRSGYLTGWGQPFDREVAVAAELLETPSLRLAQTLSFDFSTGGCCGDSEEFGAGPTNDSNGGHMFSATATAVFEWDAKARKFVTLDLERAEAVDDAMLGASDYLVEHFCPELQKYVQDYRGQCGPWLRWLRSECDIEANRLVVDSLIALDS